MQQILKNTDVTLAIVFSAGNADGAVTVTITDADGNVLVNAETATPDVSTPPVAGRYTYVFPPHPNVALLTIVWSGKWNGVAMSITAQAEIVGNHLFTLSELRGFADKALADPATYPDETLADTRARITELFERRCSVSFIPRWGSTTIDGRGFPAVWLDHRRIRTPILTATLDGAVLAGTDLTNLTVYPSGKIDRQGYYSWWPYSTPGNVVFTYEHGWVTPPAEIARCGMILARYELTASVLADRMITMSNEFGIVRQAQPSVLNVTGIPIIDSTLARYDETPHLVLF